MEPCMNVPGGRKQMWIRRMIIGIAPMMSNAQCESVISGTDEMISRAYIKWKKTQSDIT